MKYILTTLSLFVINVCFCQNGKIIDQEKISITDDIISATKKFLPQIVDSISHVDYYKITYLSDGLKVTGYMAVPHGAEKFPCLIFNRGGNQDFGKIDTYQMLGYMGVISSWGYVVVGSQYRGNDGGEGKEEFGGKDIDDVMNLIPLLASISNADTSRMGIYGVSRGGMMTYKALTKTNRFKAAISISGSADEVQGMKDRPEFDSLYLELVPGYSKNKMAALQERSAFYFAEQMNKSTPILILQGTADWRVPTNEVLPLVDKLYTIKHPVRFILFEGGTHGLMEYIDEIYRQMKLFFDIYVKEAKKWPTLEPNGT
ncbi:alpha/beta hydrolase family protein [Pinibacter soli]|uniref:Prolyl oligopeptidase family serine peptidase n=1 Tax=Pinibacter soli TaxID=3044211 RepID=A0ABT6RGB9_9BACT|nr:prolyl oligopeptidase family serine peptidase [Pinibacter soli]MDI3320897.1 prolyl oligopeptidase family serine peptidase [Pinibacter soli]